MASKVYTLTKEFPDNERYGLTSQIRRSAVSIPSNIAEGSGRESDKQFAHFLNISTGSLHELLTQLIIARNLNYLNLEQFGKINNELMEIKNMIFVFRTKVLKSSI